MVIAVVSHIGGCDRLRCIKSVIEMPCTASISYLGSEFDDFLFAPIGEERNGMPLSVVSALARSDLDPWQEAAQLARLACRGSDPETGLVDCHSSRSVRAAMGLRGNCHPADRASASPGCAARINNSTSRHWHDEQAFYDAHLDDRYDAHVERPMDRSEPSTTAHTRHGCFGSDLQHGRAPRVAATLRG